MSDTTTDLDILNDPTSTLDTDAKTRVDNDIQARKTKRAANSYDTPGDTHVAELLNTFLDEVIALRKTAGITQNDISGSWGKTQPHVSNIETGNASRLEVRTLLGYLIGAGATVTITAELPGIGTAETSTR